MTLFPVFHHRFHDLGAHFYHEFTPQGLQNPKLECVSSAVAQQLGLTDEAIHSDEFLQVFSGNQLSTGMRPLAQDYAGHQFGKFNPFLGDGRAVLLGELQTPQGMVDVCLKGIGRTPFARSADGKAGIGECLHEFHITEQLATLGVPTSRCLCVISGSEQVYRSGFEASAMLTRIAPTHIRFGTFENYFFQKNTDALQKLADHAIAYYFPDCLAATDKYTMFFHEVVLRTARLIAHWQAVGFVHGVMNTDNQSILGITLDVGASTFTAERDESFVAHSGDEHKRYAFGQQPVVGLWNCNVLARALSPLISAQALRDGLLLYEPEYLRHYANLTA